MSIFTLTPDNAPFAHAVKEAMPGFLFDYDVENKPEGRSMPVHILRSAITLGSYAIFIVAGLVEKAVRFTLDLIKQGIDKVLTKEQQDNIKAKAEKAAKDTKEAGEGFFHTHFASFFGKTPA